MRELKRRILCAESHDDTCYLLRHLLERSDYELQVAHSIVEALNLARSQRFDLYLLGGIFKDGTGVELCRQIRQIDPHTPILFFSSYARESDRQQALCAGAQGYLVKPGNIFELADTIKRLIDQAEQISMEKAKAPDQIDRRGKPRINEPFPAMVFGVDASGAEFESKTVLDNLSASGLHLRLAQSLRQGAKLSIVVRPSIAPDDKVPTLRVAVNGVVLRAEPQPDGRYGLGIALHNADFFEEWSWSLRG